MTPARRRTIFSVVICLSAIVALASVGVVMERSLQEDLDERLGRALMDQARLVSLLTDPISLGVISEFSVDDSSTQPFVMGVLAQAQEATGAESVMLLSPGGELVAAYPPSSADETFLALDSSAVAEAVVLGEPSAGRLRRVGQTYLKSAFAPVTDLLGEVVGIVGIEAPATFFGTLTRVRRSLAWLVGLAALVAVILTVFVHRLATSFEKSERASIRGQHLATMGQMAATMAHEIRNPLAIVKATAERLKRVYGDDDEIFDFIPDEVDRLDRLTNWYLDFAKEGVGQRRVTTLSAVAMESVGKLRTELEGGSVTLELQADEGMGRCLADHERLVQAAINLLINARQAMPGGGTLSVRVTESERWAKLTIEDSGEGIADDRIDAVFEPFHTSKNTGSGLGLAVVKKVAEANGGIAGISSEVGVGTTAWIELPRSYDACVEIEQ